MICFSSAVDFVSSELQGYVRAISLCNKKNNYNLTWCIILLTAANVIKHKPQLLNIHCLKFVHLTRDLCQSAHECRNFFTYSLFASDGDEELNKKRLRLPLCSWVIIMYVHQPMLWSLSCWWMLQMSLINVRSSGVMGFASVKTAHFIQRGSKWPIIKSSKSLLKVNLKLTMISITISVNVASGSGICVKSKLLFYLILSVRCWNQAWC